MRGLFVGEVTGREVRDSLTLFTQMTGLPASVVGRPGGFALDVATERVEPTGPVDLLRGLVTGTAAAGTRR